MTGVVVATLGAAGISVLARPPVPSGTSGTDTVITETVVVTVTPPGGYSYAWAFVSGDASIAIGSPSSASTSFSATMLSPATISASFVCTVTLDGRVIGAPGILALLTRT